MSKARWLGAAAGLAALVGLALVAARPDPEAAAQDAVVAGLVLPAPLSAAARASAEAQLEAAGRYGGRMGPASARALVMAMPAAPDGWARWVVSSARDQGEGRLSPAEQAAVVGWLGRGALDPSGLRVAKAWAQIAADDPNAVAVTLADPAALSSEWREDGLLAVVVAKEMVGQPADVELAALHAVAPTHRRACLPLLRAAVSAGRLREVEALAQACSADGPIDGLILRSMAQVDDQLGRSAAARAGYARGGFGLHAAAVALQTKLVGGEADWRAAVADPVPPAALHLVMGGLLLDDAAAVTEGVARLARLGVFEGEGEPTFRVAGAAGALSLGEADRALRALGALDGPEAQVLRARALVAVDPAAARAAISAARARRPASPQLLLAWQRLFPADDAQLRDVAAGLDPVEVALEGIDLDRDRPWAAILPPGAEVGPPDFGLGPLLPVGVAAVAHGLDTGRCPPLPADVGPRVAAWCGDLAAADALGLGILPIEAEGRTVGDLSLIARVAAARGDSARCAAALDAAAAAAPGMLALARERYWLLR